MDKTFDDTREGGQTASRNLNTPSRWSYHRSLAKFIPPRHGTKPTRACLYIYLAIPTGTKCARLLSDRLRRSYCRRLRLFRSRLPAQGTAGECLAINSSRLLICCVLSRRSIDRSCMRTGRQRYFAANQVSGYTRRRSKICATTVTERNIKLKKIWFGQ